MQKQFNDLMQKKNWQQAFDIIKHYDGNDEKILYIKSLLCRLYNQYDLEKELVEHALTLNSNSQYMLERKQWHNTSWFKRLSPRPSISLPRDNKYIPKQQTLDKLCIVLAADDKYFELLVECIESIKATGFYKHTDIKILDVGLTRQQYFLDRWDIEPIAPGWPVKCESINFFKHYFKPPYNVQAENYIDNGDHCTVLCDQIRYAQAVLNKPFLHELFPEYDYYLWIDADCWVQDERGLDKLVCLAEKQGYAFPSAFVPKHLNPDLSTCRVPETWHPHFVDRPTTASSIFCNSKTFQKKWADQYKEAGNQCGFWWGQEEEVASYCMEKNSEIIEFSEVLYLYRHFGFPVVKAGETILRNPESLKVIPILGLGLDKQRYFYPVAQYHNNVLTRYDLLNCIKAVGLDIDWSKDTPNCFTDQKLVSFRYRCMPSHSYAMLGELLENQPNLTVEQELDIASGKTQRMARKKEVGIYKLSVMDKKDRISDPVDTHKKYSDMESASYLKTHEFIALREAQIIVKMRDEHIQKLEIALQEAQSIVEKKESQIQKLDVSLQEAQYIVKERDAHAQRLEPALQNAQSIVKEQAVRIQELDTGLQEAQSIVKQRDAQIQRLDPALQEAQSIAKEQVVRIQELDAGLQEAQGIVKQRDAQIQRLDPALQEAQSIVKEQVVRIQELDIGLQEATNIVKQRDAQIQRMDPALQEAQCYAWKRESEIQTLKIALLEAQKMIKKKGVDK